MFLYLDHGALDHCPKDITAKPQPEGEEAHRLKNHPGESIPAWTKDLRERTRKRPAWLEWSDGGALVFSPRLVHMLETWILYYALFIILLKIGNSYALMEVWGLIRKSRTMAQGPGQFQRRKKSLTQFKAKAILKCMKDLNINEVTINPVVLYWGIPLLPMRTPLFSTGLKYQGSDALGLPGKYSPWSLLLLV